MKQKLKEEQERRDMEMQQQFDQLEAEKEAQK